MTKKLVTATRASSSGMAALAMLAAIPCAFSQEIVKTNIPFPFRVGAKVLPAGEYQFQIDREAEVVSVLGPDGTDKVLFVTTLSAPLHSGATDAHVIFDKVGTNYTLSEIWEPGLSGVLVYATKGKHEHEVVHVKEWSSEH